MDDLKSRQEKAAVVETKMLEFLVNFDPAGHLSLNDAKTIADFAKTFAFEAFSAESN